MIIDDAYRTKCINQETDMIREVKPPVVSVIIPVYNVEDYLGECLDSVLVQTESDIEIICVNDGSIDGSRSILEEYSRLDARIIIIDKENGGQSSARNVGFDAAKGEYIYFLDSDDMIRPDTLETCCEYYSREKLDVLFFDGVTIFENDRLRQSLTWMEHYLVRKGCYKGVMSGPEFFCGIVQNNEFRAHISVQFVRRNFLIENDIKFVEGIMYQDADYTLRRLLCAKRVMHLPEKFFFRRVRENSAVTSVINAHRLYSRYHSLKQIYYVFEQYDLTYELLIYAKKLIHKRQYNLVKDYNEASEEQRQIFIKMLSAYETLDFAILVESIIEEHAKKREAISTIKGLAERIQSIENSRSYKVLKKVSNALRRLYGEANK